MISAVRHTLAVVRRGKVRVGWCVRLDWPDGTHHLVAYRAGRSGARRAAAGLERYWSRGQVAPVSCGVVAVSRHDWRLHRFRTGCRAPDCPTSTDPEPDRAAAAHLEPGHGGSS